MNEIKIIHIPELQKFMIKLSPRKYTYLKYRISGEKLYIEKTYTPPEYRGKGIASKLMLEVLKYSQENNLKIVPICSFAVFFFKKHTEYSHLLAEDYKKLP